MDNVIDVNKYPLKEIEETTRASRKIGLGVMGFAEMLMRLGIGYNTKKGLDTGRELMAFIQKEAKAGVRGAGRRAGQFSAV